MSDIFKQTGKTAKDIAKQTARQIAQEPVEILKSTTRQGTGIEPSPSASVIDQIVTADGKIPQITKLEEKKLENITRKKIEELEEELKKMRNTREQRSQEWQESQNTLMGHTQTEQPISEKPLVEPTTMPKRGMFGVAKRKQGTKEIGKQISG